MRGEGRYFGVSDAPSGIICSNCHQRGHKRANCKTVVCAACGMLNDHYSNQCPQSIVCSNCGEKGHLLSKCDKKMRRIYCQTCASNKHTADNCPSIWRSYLTINDNKRLGLPTNIYCYNCADKGHYGDECPQRRSSRVPNLDGSAFSGHNLPKQLRDKYFNLHHKRKRDDDSSSYYGRSNDSYDDSHYEPQQKKKGLVDKIKTAFSSKKDKKSRDEYNNNNNDDYYDEPSRKKSKKNKNKNKNQNDLRASQSMPTLKNQPSKSGFLPSRGARLTYEFPRNSNSGFQDGGNNRDAYFNATRSGYLQPQGNHELRPSRSGTFGGRFSQKKRNASNNWK